MDLTKIIKEVRSGSHEAFKQLVEHYQEYTFRLAFKIVCNENDAKDVVQDSFIKVWRNINSYKPSAKFSTWLYKIVTNTAIDLHRKQDRNTGLDINEPKNLIHALSSDNPGKKLENLELGSILQEVAGELPEKQRMVFVLRDLQGMESQEVQQILEMTETVVKSNLYHARKAIKEKLLKLKVYERR